MAQPLTDFDRLWEIQLVDGALRAARESLASHPDRQAFESMQRSAQQLEQQIAQDGEAVRGLRLEVHRAELELKAAESEVEALDKRLYSGQVNNPKELTSIQARLDGGRARVEELQDRALGRMVELEETEKRLDGARKELERVRQDLTAAQSRWEATRERLDREIERLSDRRAGLVAAISDPLFLQRYERLAAAKDGHAMALVDGEKCTGCGVPLSNYYLIEARRKVRMMLCEVCGRILYHPAEGTSPPASPASSRA